MRLQWRVEVVEQVMRSMTLKSDVADVVAPVVQRGRVDVARYQKMFLEKMSRNLETSYDSISVVLVENTPMFSEVFAVFL